MDRRVYYGDCGSIRSWLAGHLPADWAQTEIIDDGVTGLLFTSVDANDLAAKGGWAIANPERAEMGLAARRVYELKYTDRARELPSAHAYIPWALAAI